MLPLRSLKVLDLTCKNPYIGSLFADYGAEVIKIEPPETGDPIRQRGLPESDYYAYYGRGKKSVTCDYTTAEGMALIKAMLPSADMLVVNASEEKMREYGLSCETALSINKKLIYGVLTPFGEEGPWKDLPDYDLLVMAKAGLLEKTGFAERPTKFGFPIGYYYSAWELAAGMLAACFKAMRTGEGCKVSTSIWHTVMSVDDTFAECLLGMNELPKRLGNGFPTANPTDTFRCKDGWFTLSIGSDDQWISFAERVGNKVWAEDPRYAHDPARSMENYFGDLDGQLKDYFATITVAEADQICRDAMVPGGPCNTVDDLLKDEQVRVREMLVHVADSGGGQTLQIGKAAKFLRDDENDNHFMPARVPGADTEEILKSLGKDDRDLEKLKQARII
ncbi:MAG: CoA transferase [Lachnospiraceae bacterium]|nr:CoA transferase [Lachnospiraceae bacterium]